MAKRNKELITETAEVLLKKIQASSEMYRDPEQVKALAEAFALVAEHDTDEEKPRSAGVM